MFGPCRLDREQHLIIHPPLEDWVKRQASPDERERIFAYHHLREKTYVIGWWVHKGQGLFVDLFNLGNSLANFSRSDAQSIQCTLRGNNTSDRLKQNIGMRLESQASQEQDECEAMSERLERNPMVNY